MRLHQHRPHMEIAWYNVSTYFCINPSFYLRSQTKQSWATSWAQSFQTVDKKSWTTSCVLLGGDWFGQVLAFVNVFVGSCSNFCFNPAFEYSDVPNSRIDSKSGQGLLRYDWICETSSHTRCCKVSSAWDWLGLRGISATGDNPAIFIMQAIRWYGSTSKSCAGHHASLSLKTFQSK